MKKILSLLLLIFLAFGGVFIPQNNTYALICAPSYKKIGVVKELEPKLILENVYAYSSQIVSEDFSENLKIERLEEVVQSYVNLKLHERSIQQYSDVSYSFIPIEDTNDFLKNHISGVHQSGKLSKGDIVINGGPGHVCDFALVGSFSNNGVPKEILVSSFDAYSYKGIVIQPIPEQEINCNEDSCGLIVKFDIIGQEFIVSKGESFSPENTYIESIKLFRASKEIRVLAGLPLQPISYLIVFNENASLKSEGPTAEPTQTPEVKPTPKNEAVTPYNISSIVLYLIISLVAVALLIVFRKFYKKK